MSWGTSYKYEGYIRDVGIQELEEVQQEQTELIDQFYKELIALAAATPPASGNIQVDDDPIPWTAYVVNRVDSLKQGLSEAYWLRTCISQALEAKEDNPDNLEEG